MLAAANIAASSRVLSPVSSDVERLAFQSVLIRKPQNGRRHPRNADCLENALAEGIIFYVAAEEDGFIQLRQIQVSVIAYAKSGLGDERINQAIPDRREVAVPGEIHVQPQRITTIHDEIGAMKLKPLHAAGTIQVQLSE